MGAVCRQQAVHLDAQVHQCLDGRLGQVSDGGTSVGQREGQLPCHLCHGLRHVKHSRIHVLIVHNAVVEAHRLVLE